MKTIFLKYSLLLLIFLGFSAGIEAQYITATDNIAGLNLDQVKRNYERALQRGDSSYTIHYAEALYIQRMFEQAYEMYSEADRLGLVISKYQQRDFAHAAKHVGKDTPYTVDTGYFDRSWDIEVQVSPFCSNSPMEDFAPFYWKDLLFITSSRNISGRQYDYTQNPFLNIVTFIHDCISTDIPDALPKGINTQNHDGPIAISADGNLLIITRNHSRSSSEGIYNLYMEYYVREDNRWSEAKTFPLIDTEFSVQHPYYSDNDNLLYFSSNVGGGHGGFDLYRSRWDGSGWGEPENLGPEINSPYDEVFPAQTPDGTLIYASNHIETSGGLDLVLFRDGIRYLFPEPFNSVYDDFSITFRNESSGYFASGRDARGFIDNIYVFEIIGPFWPEYNFYLEVLDKESKEPVEGALVSFAADAGVGENLTSEQGMVFLHSGSKVFYDYHFQLSKEGYQDKETVSSAFLTREGDYVVTLLLEKKVVAPIEEETLAQGFFELYFDNDRPDPRSTSPTTQLTYQQTFYAYMLRKDDYYRNSVSSREELDAFFQDVEKGMEQLKWLSGYLKREMEDSISYTIIFTSHASPLASSEYNLVLSKRRFVSVENFIQDWDNGSLQDFIETGKLDYSNNPFGELQARPNVSADRQDPARSVYSVEAARERKVTISWQKKDSAEPEPTFIREQFDNRARTAPTAPEQIQDSAKEFHIIVGSFTNIQQARQEATRLQERDWTEVRVLPISDTGRYRVSYGAYADMKDAMAALQSIRRNIRNDAWILILE